MTEVWNKLPPNPEQDAFHILADGDIQYVVRWKPSRGWMDEYLPIWADECSYVGQLYTEAEVRAERDRLREVLRDCVETWRPLLADADLTAHENPAYLTLMRADLALGEHDA
ncbi:MAG: hypothetical protein RLZZ187_2608 [Pseudomonadota bacterium]|jgi:hypothetical protein